MSTLGKAIAADAAEARAELHKLLAAVGEDYSTSIAKLHGLINRLEGNKNQLAEHQDKAATVSTPSPAPTGAPAGA